MFWIALTCPAWFSPVWGHPACVSPVRGQSDGANTVSLNLTWSWRNGSLARLAILLLLPVGWLTHVHAHVHGCNAWQIFKSHCGPSLVLMCAILWVVTMCINLCWWGVPLSAFRAYQTSTVGIWTYYGIVWCPSRLQGAQCAPSIAHNMPSRQAQCNPDVTGLIHLFNSPSPHPSCWAWWMLWCWPVLLWVREGLIIGTTHFWCLRSPVPPNSVQLHNNITPRRDFVGFFCIGECYRQSYRPYHRCRIAIKF